MGVVFVRHIRIVRIKIIEAKLKMNMKGINPYFFRKVQKWRLGDRKPVWFDYFNIYK